MAELKTYRKGVYTMGALIRGSFRRACMQLDLKYEEDKGFLDSGFVVEGDFERVKLLDEWLRKING